MTCSGVPDRSAAPRQGPARRAAGGRRSVVVRPVRQETRRFVSISSSFETTWADAVLRRPRSDEVVLGRGGRSKSSLVDDRRSPAGYEAVGLNEAEDPWPVGQGRGHAWRRPAGTVRAARGEPGLCRRLALVAVGARLEEGGAAIPVAGAAGRRRGVARRRSRQLV